MIIGLTGGIASGKSTVTTMLKQHNIPVIDADMIAREVVMPGQDAYHQIIDHFGESVLLADNTINRKQLGQIIFNDEKERAVLNSIVHPAVRKTMIERKTELLKEGVKHIAYDIPLLFESKLTHMVDKVILVYVDEDVQLTRLVSRDNCSEKEAISRIQSQMPLKEKIALADEVIYNNGAIEQTKQQLIQILTKWNIITT
ncbi:dephospho-CoA kinase [Alkalihalobacillus sp. LMS39]|uniref:dephospho-CoA kinase n=1 Tax=Alkalihalobacillus sp. LMS39 TaxID=2924032 RepID=UPI001FB54DF9|nr:dephospho-CoA kinase [Alkalihalobacillus sp. LMS39]UOE93408.1 dephospho-CoA kinase [Alkalihalobacillus sp. LMS39]